MKLLLDANLSWRLVNKLKLYFEDCFHVDHVGLTVPAKDSEIWNYALINNLIIATNDDDFLNLASGKGFPPKVILLGTGNQSNGYILELLITHRDDINALDNSGEYGFLEIL
jgi:predicted nuclease of predicted toxin-antitoxin system